MFEGPELAQVESIGANGAASYGGDDKLIVTFYRGTRLNAGKSRDAGTPIYDPVDMVRIIQPGERDVAEYQATIEYQRRWPRQWAAYQANMEQTQGGTPLEMLFPTQPEIVATLRAIHVTTVQQLAAINDTAMGNVPMGRQLVNSAKQYLAKAGEGSEFHALKKENADLKADLGRLAAQVEDLSAKLDDKRVEERNANLAKAREAKAAKAAAKETGDVAA